MCLCFFFFSSRRRHTRLVSDWSSDVCSSDLVKDFLFYTSKFDFGITAIRCALQQYNVFIEIEAHITHLSEIFSSNLPEKTTPFIDRKSVV